MRLTPALAAAVALAVAPALAPTVASAQAPAACAAPTAPTLPDAAAATGDQMKTAMEAVKAFLAASDAYQQCEIESVTAQRKAAKDAKTKFDEGQAKAAQARIAANQKEKESVGVNWGAAVKAYKAAHPS
jgi:hypothetical protein